MLRACCITILSGNRRVSTVSGKPIPDASLATRKLNSLLCEYAVSSQANGKNPQSLEEIGIAFGGGVRFRSSERNGSKIAQSQAKTHTELESGFCGVCVL